MKTGVEFITEARLLKKSGGYIYAEEMGKINWTDGKPTHLTGIIRDVTERKRAEQELKLRANLLDAANDSIIIHDFEGNIIYVNEATCELRGYSRNELLNMNLRNLMTEEYRKLMEPRLKELLENGKIRIESAHYRKDKSIIHNEVNARTIELDGKKVVMSIGRDITYQKTTEEALIQSGQQYRDLFDNNPQPMWVYDRVSLAFVAINESAIEHYGYSREEFLSMTLKDIRPPEEIEKLLQNVASVDTPYQKSNGWRHKKKDGTIIDVEIISHSIEWNGRPARIVLANDVTERKRTEEALRESEKQYRSLFDGMMDGVYRSTHDGKFVEVNPAMVEMFGFNSKEEMLQVDIKKELYFEQSDRDSLFLDTGQEKTEIFRMRRKDGSEIWVEDHGHYVHDDKGNVIFHEGILRDVTDRLTAEKTLQEKERLLSEAQRIAHIGSWSVDIATGKIIWSAEMYHIHGVTPETFEHTFPAFLQLIHPDDRESMVRWIETALSEGREKELDFRTILPGGEIRYIRSSVEATFDKKGKPIQAIGAAQDITESKQAEQLQSSIYRIANAAEGAKNLDSLFKAVHTIIADVMPAKNFYIALYDGKNDIISFPYFVDEIDVQPSPPKLGKGFTEYVLRTGKSLLCDAKRSDELMQQGETELVGVPSSIWLGVPLKMETRTIGVMVLQHYSDPKAYNEREQQVLEFVSSEIARVIEHKRSEEALRLSEERYRTLIETAPDVIYNISIEDGTIKSLNPAFEQATGWSREEWIGKSFIGLVHADDLSLAAQVIKQISRGVTPPPYEIRILSKSGEYRVGEFTSSPLIENGRVVGELGIVRDVTERKQAEQQLRLQASALESVANAIVIANRDGNIIWVNSAFTSLTGYTSDEAISQNPRILKSGKHDASYYQSLWNSILAGNVWRGEIVNKRKDGSFYNEDMTITPVRGANDEITHFIAIKQDITEKKKFETQTLRNQRMESVGVLAGGIAHDLNNVLAPIMMGIELLKKKPCSDQDRKMLDIIAASVQRGTNIVRQVLTFSRGIDGERSILQPKHLVHEIETFARETFPKNLIIRTKIWKDLWTIMGDATQIHQVLLNLCVNARDAMPNGGTLTISGENIFVDSNYARLHSDVKTGPYVLLKVKDTGTGIPDDIKENIFDPFFTTKEVGKGTGLGLSTVMGIVKSHGGFVNLYTEIENGSEFKIYLPAVESSETKQIEHNQSLLPRGNGETVLIVDDEASVREITRSTLESYGYKILTAGDGVEAVALFALHKNEIDVVLTDMAMPIMDGIMTIRALHKLDPNVKIIATSGNIEQKSEAESQGLIVKAFLQKPYSAEKLLMTLQQVFGG
jgi:two-component system, cell cycle sensor histidine kinase and response regulator CckA